MMIHLKKYSLALGITFFTLAFVFSSGCLEFGEEKEVNKTIVLNENKTTQVFETIINNITEETEKILDLEPEGRINLTVKIYSNFEVAEIKGLRSLELELAGISIESDNEIRLINATTIDLKETKTKLTMATIEVPLSNYRAIDVSLTKATGTFELSSTIPGILSQIQEKDLIIKSEKRTIPLNQQINESAHITIRFNVANISFSKPTFENTFTTIEIVTYPSCNTNCNSQCTQEGSFESCYSSCVQNGNIACNGKAVDLCNMRCNCPNSDCTYAKDEECRSACIDEEQDPNTECKVNVISSCPIVCKEKAEYLTCMKNCNLRC